MITIEEFEQLSARLGAIVDRLFGVPVLSLSPFYFGEHVRIDDREERFCYHRIEIVEHFREDERTDNRVAVETYFPALVSCGSILFADVMHNPESSRFRPGEFSGIVEICRH